MAVTYKTLWPELPSVRVPVLHKITYGFSETPEARHEWSLKDHNIREWCNTNCCAPFYLHPGYTNEKFVQFEDDRDAVLFALRWGGK